MKKLLFLSNQLPHNFDAGGILYADIICTYGAENFSFLSLVHPIEIEEFNIRSERIINQYSLKIPRRNIFFKILRRIPLLETIYTYFNLYKFRDEIRDAISRGRFDAIFAPLRGEVLLLLPYILKVTNVPVYAMVEDTVEAEINDPYLIYCRKKKNYYELINCVKSLGVAGETMRDYFKENFGKEGTILRPSYEEFTKDYPKEIVNEFNVFFAGNTYAEIELKAFIKALERIALYSNRKVNMYIASHKSYYSNSENLTINNLGWLTQSSLKEYMGKSHIGYLPYRLEAKFKHQMKFAFPGKAGFYISNNLPVFFHGPKYSSFNTFIKMHEVGVCCDSLDPDVLSTKILEFIQSSIFYLDCQKQCQNAFKLNYSSEIFGQRVLEFFDD